MQKSKGLYSFLIKCFLFIFRLGADILKRDSGDSEDDYNDVDWTLYPDKRGKSSYKLTPLTEDIRKKITGQTLALDSTRIQLKLSSQLIQLSR